jgi:hypothetical protein
MHTCFIVKAMAARQNMNLTPVERERITDSMLKIQSARATLEKVDDSKIPDAEGIDACLESADTNLKVALGYSKRSPS